MLSIQLSFLSLPCIPSVVHLLQLPTGISPKECLAYQLSHGICFMEASTHLVEGLVISVCIRQCLLVKGTTEQTFGATAFQAHGTK
jgi:hypothetical protein